MDALIIARSVEPAWTVLPLLTRAGFDVDIVTASPLLRLSRLAREVCVVPADGLARAAAERVAARSGSYDWVMGTDDPALRDLIGVAWPEGKTPRFLPAANRACLRHVCSKIGLSQVLAEAGIKTPPFRVANNTNEAVRCARELGYPVLLKIDFSGGGYGVRECADDDGVERVKHLFEGAPFLVQKKIEGAEIDLSSIFFDGELVHFAYSVMRRSVSRFGVSSVRDYRPLAQVDDVVFAELAALGRALSASGFVTIGIIDAADGSGRYFYEADMRPNVWFEAARFLGDDAAPRIRDWFHNRKIMTKESASGGAPLTIPFFLRLKWWELAVNRYRAWKFIPRGEGRLVRRLLLNKFIGDAYETSRRVKWLMPLRARDGLRRLLIAARLFPQ